MPEATPFSEKMGTKRSSDLLVDEGNPPSEEPKASSPTNTANVSSWFEPETVQPEWLELPTELQHIDFQTEGAAAWDKYQPYSNVPPILTPVDTPPIFIDQPGHHQRALCFHLHAVDGRARAGTIHFNNTAPPVPTPRFMPVGTKATLKSVLPQEIEHMNCPMILANTYHLALQPGTPLIDSIFGGLPPFMGGEVDEEVTTTKEAGHQHQSSTKKRRLFNLLTDSGGFQMVSLAALSNVTEEGVVFESPYEKGKVTKLRPEDSIQCQNEIGADVIMQLDDVISSVQSNDERFRLATLRTLRWYDRCVKAHSKPHNQNLYPILQGHLDVSPGGLREICLAGFKHRDVISETERTIPGFAVGGLAGGEAKEDFWKVVDHACRHLPDNRPRYLMGVGYPLDLVVCTALGIDQYDCVYPTRTARFGVALVDRGGILKLKQHEFATQRDSVVMEGCPCQACSRGVSRARIHALLKSQNVLAIQFLTQHNVCYMMGLVTRMRSAILLGAYQTFVNEFLRLHFDSNQDSDGDDNHGKENSDNNNNDNAATKIPQWVRDALDAAGVRLSI